MPIKLKFYFSTAHIAFADARLRTQGTTRHRTTQRKILAMLDHGIDCAIFPKMWTTIDQCYWTTENMIWFRWRNKLRMLVSLRVSVWMEENRAFAKGNSESKQSASLTQADRWFSHASTICSRGEKLNVIAHFLKWMRVSVFVSVAFCVLLMLRTRHRAISVKKHTSPSPHTKWERGRKFNLNSIHQPIVQLKKHASERTKRTTLQ